MTTDAEPGSNPQDSRPPIPADVWLQVALDADPLDILSLSQTCKDWQELFSEKPIWVAMLRAYMDRQGQLLPSPDSIDKMTTDELRRAAVGPQRWMRLIHGRAVPLSLSETGANLIPARLLTYTDVLPLASEHPIYHLVPGGRFLVTGKLDHTSATVTVWDIGSPFVIDSGHRGPRLIAQYSSSLADSLETYHDDRKPHMTGDVCLVGEAELRVVASYSHPASSEASALVLSISFSDQVPLFRPLGTLRCEASSLKRSRIFGDKALFLLDTGVLLWNFAESLASICSRRSSGPILGPDQEVVLTEDYAILLKTAGASTSISAWEISRLPMVPHTSRRITSAQAACEPHVELPAPFYGTVRTVCVHGEDRKANSVVFDIQGFVEAQGSDPVMKRYGLQLTGDGAPWASYGTVKELGTAYLPSPHYVQAPRELSTGMGLFSLNKGAGAKGARMHTVNIAPAHSPTGQAMGTNLGGGYPIASCAYSGRVIFQRRSWRGEKLYCADYLCEQTLEARVPNMKSPASGSHHDSKPRVGPVGKLLSKSLRLSLK